MMIFNMVEAMLRSIGFILISIMVLNVGAGYSSDSPAKSVRLAATQSEKKTDPGEWAKVLEAAKKEGLVVIYSALANRPRRAVDKAFMTKYSIAMEWLSGRGSETITKVESERRAGIYSGDVLMAGVNSQTMFRSKGLLESMDRALLLPEVRDPKQWMYGRLPFVDNKHMMLSYFISAGNSVVINTDLVKAEEIKSYNDLLAPKWKGKIVMQDPTVTGGGQTFFIINILEIMGKEFGYKLARQEPIISKDRRLSLEWVARGKYPIILASDSSFLGELKASGAPLKHIVPREGTYSSGASGGVAMLNKAAHPNAAIVFLNWLLSKEGQTIMAEAQPDQSRRLDVPTGFSDVERRIDPNLKYVDRDVEKYLDSNLLLTSAKIAKEMFGHLIQ